jgi:hypothetical protein
MSSLCDYYVDGYIKTKIGVHQTGWFPLILLMPVMKVIYIYMKIEPIILNLSF